MITIAHFALEDWEKEYIKSKVSGNSHIFIDSEDVEGNIEQFKDAEVLSVFIYNKVTAKVIDALPNLKLIITRSTGFDHIDIEHAKQKDIPVCNVKAYGSNTIAEHTFALLLSLAKYLPVLAERSKKANFEYKDCLGFELNGKKLGVIGSGRIGANVIQIAKAFNMEILVYDVFQNADLAKKVGFEYVDLDTVLKNADILSIHVPFSKETESILSRENLDKLKKDVIFINTSRGALIKNEDLIYALDSGIFKAAGLDTIDGENQMYLGNVTLEQKNILVRDNVIFSPHSAYYTKDALMRILDSTIEHITGFEKGEINDRVN